LFIKQYATIQPLTVWQKATAKGGMQGGLNGFYDLADLNGFTTLTITKRS